MADLVAHLVEDRGEVWISSPDAAKIPDPLYRKLLALGGVYRPGKSRRVWFRNRAVAGAAVEALGRLGYVVELSTGGPEPDTAPHPQECALCTAAYRWGYVVASGECCRGCGEVLRLVPPPSP